MNPTEERLHIPASAKQIDRLVIVLISVLGGMLTAYIGVAIEKALASLPPSSSDAHYLAISLRALPCLLFGMQDRCGGTLFN